MFNFWACFSGFLLLICNYFLWMVGQLAAYCGDNMIPWNIAHIFLITGGIFLVGFGIAGIQFGCALGGINALVILISRLWNEGFEWK